MKCINNFESNVSKHQYGILRTDTDNIIVDYLPPATKATKKTISRSRVISKPVPSESPSYEYNLRSSALKLSDESIVLVKKPKKIAKEIKNAKEKKEWRAKLARSGEIVIGSEHTEKAVSAASMQQLQQKNELSNTVVLSNSMMGIMQNDRVEKEVDGEIVIDAINNCNACNDLHKSMGDKKARSEEEWIRNKHPIHSTSDRTRETVVCNAPKQQSTSMGKGMEIMIEGEEHRNNRFSMLRHPSTEKKDENQKACEEDQGNVFLQGNTPKEKRLSDKPASTTGKEESAEDIIKMISLQNNDIEFESSSDFEQEQKQIPPEPPSYVKPLYKVLGIQVSCC